MDILIFIGLLILSGLLNFIWEPDARIVHSLAKVYLLLAIILSAAVWIFYFAGVKNDLIISWLKYLLEWGGYLGHIVLGYLLVNILISSKSENDQPGNHLLKKIIGTTMWGLSILIGNSFIVATVGKSTNIGYMIDFFRQSGYATWFLYFIMTAETAGAFGILLHFRLKTGIWAALGLILIMLGAVYTHWHNKDPFSDSYAAIAQVLNLALIIALYYFEKQVGSKLVDTSIYIV